MSNSAPTGVNKILVEKYGYEWVNGKAWRPGTAPETEVPTIDVTPGPLPDWIIPPPADAFVTQALETLTNPVTGEKFTVPTGGYTVNVSAPTPIEETSPTPTAPVATSEPEPAPTEPVSLEEKIEQLQASLSELQKKYEEALQKLEQANARIAELEGQKSEAPVEDQSLSDSDPKPEVTPSPTPEPSKPEAPAVETPEPAPTPTDSEPTGINKILVEKYGYEWVNGKAWKPGTAPEATSPATPVTTYEINPDNALQTIVTNAIAVGDPGDEIELDLKYLENAGTKLWNFSAQTIELPAKYGSEITELAPTTAYFDGDYIDLSEVVKFSEIDFEHAKGDDFIYLKGVKFFNYEGFDVENYGNDVLIGDFNYAVALHDLDGIAFDASIIDGNFDMETPNGSIHAEQIYRLDGNDLANTLTGDDNNNKFRGDDGDDIIYGNGGDDDIGGREDNDQLFGGDGNDTLDGGPGNDTLDGGAGNDLLEAWDGDDILTGGSGADTFQFTIDDETFSFGHNKILDFNPRYDKLEFFDANWNFLPLSSFEETLNADNQRVLTLKENGSSVTIIEEVIEVQARALIGTDGNDVLTGGPGNDNIQGLGGDDNLDGAFGDDTLSGGSGDDTYHYAYYGSDTISDSSGYDTLYLTTTDRFGNSNWGDGGYFSGNDLVISSSSTSLNKLTIKNAKLNSSAIENLTYHTENGSWADYTSKIALNGEVSNTTPLIYFGTLGNDSISTGLAYAEVYLNDGDDTAVLGNNGGWARGGNGNDSITAGEGDHNIYGHDGNDTLDGGAGNDTLDGGKGDDIINGGSGDDIINDGLGDDIVDAGEGNDTYTRDFDLTDPNGKWIPHIDLENEGLFTPTFPGVKGDELKNFENVTLKGSLDTIVTGDKNGNIISTGNGADKLYGKAGNDTLDGGAGNDTLNGGDGNDTLTGGAGSDTFVFGLNFGTDIITDFERGVDVLNYEGVALVGTTLDGNEFLSFKDGSSITLKGTESSNPTHNSFSVGDNIFTLVSSAKSYQEATEYAAGIGAKLISFEDDEKFDGFYDAVSNVITAKGLSPTTAQDGGGATYIWLGATDQVTEGTWIWESGSQMSFNNWGSGAYGSEPDNFDNQDGLALGLENWPVGSSDGAGYGDAGYWNDVDLSNELFFVIEVL